MRRRILAAAAVGVIVWGLSISGPQAEAGLPQVLSWVEATNSIPKDGFRTWSLFLICDAAWLSPGKASNLNRLYESFERFGRNIGDENVAVWFWKRRMLSSSPELPANVDVERSVRLCRQWELPPSEGPYVAWTPEYPNEASPSGAKPKGFEVISLGGLPADKLAELLGRAGDRLALGGSIVGPQPSFFLRFLGAAQEVIRDFGCSFNVKFATGAVSAELRDCRR